MKKEKQITEIKFTSAQSQFLKRRAEIVNQANNYYQEFVNYLIKEYKIKPNEWQLAPSLDKFVRNEKNDKSNKI